MSEPSPDDPSTGRAVPADAIVVAAGRSTRMGGLDKLTAEVAGRPLLAWAIDGLTVLPEIERIVVVASPDRVASIQAAPWLPSRVVAVVPGGERRQVSVAAGFAALERLDADATATAASAGVTASDDRPIVVHDGARPVVDPAMVRAVISAVAAHGAAVPILPIAETVKRIDGDLVGATVDRDGLGLAQTPQGVRRGLLRAAYARFPADGEPTFTDEAALLEACRIAVHVVPGDPSNLKVTRPTDLPRAAAALSVSPAARVGIGQDRHPFGPGSPLALGGVEIAGAPRLHGHSDGDVALHAVCDALLGAAGLGDLGRLFPADASTPEGIASGEMLDEVVRRVTTGGWRVSNVDLTIVAARPRLADHLDPMRDAIAARLGVDAAAVNVKASSGNLLGDEGAGRSISATAIAMLEAAA